MLLIALVGLRAGKFAEIVHELCRLGSFRPWWFQARSIVLDRDQYARLLPMRVRLPLGAAFLFPHSVRPPANSIFEIHGSLRCSGINSAVKATFRGRFSSQTSINDTVGTLDSRCRKLPSSSGGFAIGRDRQHSRPRPLVVD